MSEKRFECVFKEHETKNSWSMIKDNQLDKPLYIKDVVDLLNTLHQENQQLKHYKLYEDNKRLQTIIAELKKENEQLQQEIIVYKKAFQQQVQRCTL